MANERLRDKVFDVICTLLFTRWWAGLLVGAALVAGGAYWLRFLAEAFGQRVEPLGSVREMLGASALTMFGVCLMALGLINLFSRGSKDNDQVAERILDILFTRWWAGLCFGVTLLAGGAYLLWDVAEAPWPQSPSGLDIFWALSLGLLGVCWCLFGLCLVPCALFNLFSRSSTGSEPASANPAEPAPSADGDRDPGFSEFTIAQRGRRC